MHFTKEPIKKYITKDEYFRLTKDMNDIELLFSNYGKELKNKSIGLFERIYEDKEYTDDDYDYYIIVGYKNICMVGISEYNFLKKKLYITDDGRLNKYVKYRPDTT